MRIDIKPSVKVISIVFWILAFAAVPMWVKYTNTGWDFDVYKRAMHSLAIGHDPYLDGVAEQERLRQAGSSAIAFTYVYPPITLPVIRFLSSLSDWWVTAYWEVYVLGVLAQIWVGMKAGIGHERLFVALLAPAAAFFPGLVQTAPVLSGNIAYILYGLVLAAAWLGWRRGSWTPFYLVVLLAACFKPPYLTLLAIPLLSASGQWMPAAFTGAAGVAVFAVQPMLWPASFQNFLNAVNLQFAYNRDFGVSPSGALGLALYLLHRPFHNAVGLFYLLYAVPVFLLLLYFARYYREGAIALRQWMPAMLCGVVLLNPRLIEYDLAPITVPMGLIVYRLVTRSRRRPWPAAGAVVFFAAVNYMASWSWYPERFCGSLVLALVFAAGCGMLALDIRAFKARVPVAEANGFLPLAPAILAVDSGD